MNIANIRNIDCIMHFLEQRIEISKKIKVGAVFAMTGFGQLYGEETKKGFDLCKNENIELIVEDSQSKPTVGVTAFNKLVNIMYFLAFSERFQGSSFI
jgi:ABC-type branched-subunit amino acid transport system substrate-binding protein